MSRYIDADELISEFKVRTVKVRQWKENAILNCNEEAETRADAVLAFLVEVKSIIDNAPTVEERPKGNEKNGKGCWNCQHCKRVNKELVGEEWRCDLTDLYFGYHTLIDHWCRHWAKLKR